jgi:lipopolysaccharide biosynthesis glycosyltransferase
MLEPIVIVCAADDNYSMPLAATLQSAIANLKTDVLQQADVYLRKVTIFVIDGGISRANKRKILQSIPSQDICLSWLHPQKNLFKNVPTSQSITIAAYYRLLIPALLPKQFKKAIYLDSDLIVRGNLARLWNIDIENNYVLAVQDIGAPYVSSSRGLVNYQMLGIPGDSKYFNSGVLVMNLQKWREDCISQKVLEYLNQNKEHVRWHDQDGLNAILAGQWGELDPRWNQLPYIFKYSSWKESSLSEDVYYALRDDPYIVHFSTRDKPWRENCHHPYKNLFFQNLDMELWAEWSSQQEAKKRTNSWQNVVYNTYARFKRLVKRLIYRLDFVDD